MIDIIVLETTKLAAKRLSVMMISEQASNLEHSMGSIHPQALAPRYEHNQEEFGPVEFEIQKQKTISEPNKSMSSEHNIDDIEISQGKCLLISILRFQLN